MTMARWLIKLSGPYQGAGLGWAGLVWGGEGIWDDGGGKGEGGRFRYDDGDD